MELSNHYLFPSAIFADRSPYRITTVLGSCVAVCLYDPVKKTGGMNHYMLPLWNGQGLATPKFGNIALEKLTERMTILGSNHTNLKAKVFGGADVLNHHNPVNSIGSRNIEVAMGFLEMNHIPVIATSVGGNQGRKIIFNTLTGEVLHQFLPPVKALQP